MSKEYDGDDKRLKQQRRCCDLERVMTERSIGNWLKFVGVMLTVVIMMASVGLFFFNRIENTSMLQTKIQLEMSEKMGKILAVVVEQRTEIKNMDNNFNKHETRITRVEDDVRTLRDNFTSHTVDDVKWRNR